MKALILTADLGGNVPPTIAVGEALSRRGALVEVAGLRQGRSTLAQVPFAPATSIKRENGKQGLREFGALRRLMIGRATTAMATALIVERRADIVLVDCLTPAPLLGALNSGVPVVALFHTVGGYWRSFDRGPAGRILGLIGLRPSTLWALANVRLLLTDPDLDPARFDPALADYVWTGTTEVGTEPAARGERPHVLVTLSSSDWPGMLPVYRRIVAALSELPLEAVVTTGGVDLGGPLEGAANVEVRGWVDHAQLLPTVDLVIGHGGHSTTMKTLAHGVPLLALPVNPTADQQLLGEIIEKAGAGCWLPKSASTSSIRDTVAAILASDYIRSRASSVGKRLRATRPGAEIAAEAVLSAFGRPTLQ